MGVYWEGGRASSAPELEGFDWREWGVLKSPDGRAPVGSAGQMTRGSILECAGPRQLRGLPLPRAAAAPLRAGGSGREAGDSDG
eukprot:10583404-Alexandrium_andersonii.AAC.1